MATKKISLGSLKNVLQFDDSITEYGLETDAAAFVGGIPNANDEVLRFQDVGAATTSALADADADTTVEVEQAADDDIGRFYSGLTTNTKTLLGMWKPDKSWYFGDGLALLPTNPRRLNIEGNLLLGFDTVGAGRYFEIYGRTAGQGAPGDPAEDHGRLYHLQSDGALYWKTQAASVVTDSRLLRSNVDESILGDFTWNNGQKIITKNALQEMQIYSTTAYNVVRSVTGEIRFISSSNVADLMLRLVRNDGVFLYYNENLKFNTKSAGCHVTGELTVSGTLKAQSSAEVTGYFEVNSTDFRVNPTSGFVSIQSTLAQAPFHCHGDAYFEAAVWLREVGTTGILKIDVCADNVGQGFLEIYTDTTRAYIDVREHGRDLVIQGENSSGTNQRLAFFDWSNEEVVLYQGGGQRFVTTSYGARVFGSGAFRHPGGTTAQRPSGVNGMIRYNTSLNVIEGYSNGSWQTIV